MKRALALLSVAILHISPASAQDTPAAERKFLAPAPVGAVGLFRTVSAERGYHGPWAFTMGVTAEYFNINEFPVSGQSAERLSGRASLAYTPISPLEIFVSGWAFTSNDRSAANLVQQVGDFDYGAKMAFDFGPTVAVGPVFIGHFQKAAADLDFKSRAYTYDFLAAATWDLIPKNVPLRSHVNVGFRLDGTDALLAAPATERERVLYGVLGYNAVLAAVGVEVPVRRMVFSAEYSMEQTVNSPKAVGYLDNPQRVTLGFRYFPTKNEAMALELAGDVGFFAADGANRIVREPDWRFLAGLTYAFGAYGRIKEIHARPAEPNRATAVLTGSVTESVTNQPIGGVAIRLCDGKISPIVSDGETGRYRSYGLPSGDCKVSVAAEGYNPLHETVTLAADKEASRNFVLTRAEGAKGVVLLQVRDAGGAGMKASVSLPDLPQVQPMQTDEAGRLTMRLPVGAYRITAENGALRGEVSSVEAIEGRENVAEIQMSPSDVRLEAKSISVRQSISFLFGRDELAPASKKTLDEVARLLKAHSEIKKLEVGGHTDSVGNPEQNLRLSRRRAQAVVEYLIAQGVEGKRLSAVGYGSTNPIAPNGTKEGRFANRRVEFKMLEN
jgi:outer membrane protein OmpA-like peptidoglycan-associated protein